MTGLGAVSRHERIMDILQRDGKASVVALADAIGVSVVTIRNDLEQLERRQVLRRMRGGALAVRPARFERPVDIAAQSFVEEKERIGALAASLVRDGETIILDAGSTTLALARALPRSLQDVAVVTNALDVALALDTHPGVKVVVTGGTMWRSQRSLTAPFATLLLRQINADVAFISTAGIDAEKGFTNGNWEEAEVKHAMIAAARRIIVVADHGKIGHVGTARIAAIDEVDLLITDSGAPGDGVRALEDKGVQVVLA